MLGLYIHIPFCVRKCLYCGFYSTPYDNLKADNYLSALYHETVMQTPLLEERLIGSVYIGGGTPTTLLPDQFSLLFNIIRDHIHLTSEPEVTIEANPNTATADTLSLLKGLGVTRISIGVQSFSEQVLELLGRAHTAEQAMEAMQRARDTGFGNIGIDLIFGIPGQTAEQWHDTLETALTFAPEHISAYCLSLDEGSQWYRDRKEGRGAAPDDDTSATMYVMAREHLRSRGYHQYEISNYCLPGYECRHNVNYWDRGEYLGLGPGAWSFMGNRRWANIADLDQYVSRLIKGISAQDHDREEFVSGDQAALEKLFLGLRKTSGIDLTEYRSLFGENELDALLMRIRDLERDGLVDAKKGVLVLTDRGMLLSNEVISRIIT